MKTTAHVTVNVTVRVELSQSWGSQITIAAIREQATRDALGRLTNLLGTGASIVGSPEVVAIIVEDKAL